MFTWLIELWKSITGIKELEERLVKAELSASMKEYQLGIFQKTCDKNEETILKLEDNVKNRQDHIDRQIA